MTRCGKLTSGHAQRLAASALVASLLCGCGRGRGRGDQDAERRPQWIHEQTAANNRYVLDFLNRPGDIEFYDGWYAVEHDKNTGGAWRWMDRRGIVRLATKVHGLAQARDMELKVFGWVLHEDAGYRKLQMEFAINGHVLERFDPPRGSFEHVIFVPRWLLEHSAKVDFVITVTHALHPRGDWRELGFATTGFHWTPVEAK